MLVPMRRAQLIPGRQQNVSEMMYSFIADLIQDIIGSDGVKYLPFVFTLFISVLIGNVLGLLPYGFTFTSHIAVTGAMALLVISIVTIMGFVNHGWHFLSLFAPSGLPSADLHHSGADRDHFVHLAPDHVWRCVSVPT